MRNPHQPKTVLITGGAGFIGCNFVRHLLTSDVKISIIVLDTLTYAGNPRNLDGLEAQYGDRYRFVKGDIGLQHRPLVSGPSGVGGRNPELSWGTIGLGSQS